MSEWTHVAGCLRFDGLLFDGLPNFTEKLPEIFGRVVEFEDEDYSTTLPCGSEGSLKYLLHPGPGGCMNFGQVFIWGDLRDYSDLDAIKCWVVESTDRLLNLGVRLRSGVITAESKFDQLTYTYGYFGGVQRWFCGRNDY